MDSGLDTLPDELRIAASLSRKAAELRKCSIRNLVEREDFLKQVIQINYSLGRVNLARIGLAHLFMIREGIEKKQAEEKKDYLDELDDKLHRMIKAELYEACTDIKEKDRIVYCAFLRGNLFPNSNRYTARQTL